MASDVAEILQQETGCDPQHAAFVLAEQYLHLPN